jgi:hypothetical protein
MALKSATIELPEGVTIEMLNKIVKTYMPNKENKKNVGKAKRKATSVVLKAHKSEYDTAYLAAKKQFGVVEKN